MGVIKRNFDPSSASRDDYDSDTGLCSIECYVAFQDKYRVAPEGEMAIPWPYTYTRVSQIARDIEEKIKPEYETILREFEITMEGSHIQRLSPKHTTSDSRDTLIIFTPDTDTRRWSAAATRIQAAIDRIISMLDTDLKMRVEIRNFERMYRDYSFAVRADTPEHEVLGKAQSIVHIELARMKISRWTIISCDMRGREWRNPANKPTVMVCFPPGLKQFYDYIGTQIEIALKPLDTANSGLGLQVEFLTGLLLPSRSSEMLAAQPVTSAIDSEHPDSGFSIGPRGATEAGTAGAWVWFSRPGQPRQLAIMTCHHVVSSGDQDNRKRNDVHGIGLQGSPVPKSIVVDYPAPFDYDRTREALSRDAKDPENSPHGVARVTESLARMEKMKIDGGIGRVVVSSGYDRRVNERRMDWSVVAVRDPTFRGNNVPIPKGQLTPPQLRNGMVPYNAPGNISSIGKATTDKWAAKKGRTTGTTIGEVTSLRAICNWEDKPQSWEALVVSQVGGVGFVGGGDSGSMVYNNKKQWIGLIIGGQTLNDAGIFTPVEELLEDIKTQTGLDIELV